MQLYDTSVWWQLLSARGKVYDWIEKFTRRWTGCSCAFWATIDWKICEIKKQIDQRIRNNRKMSTDETTCEMSINHGRNQCKNGLRPNRKHCILLEDIHWKGELLYKIHKICITTVRLFRRKNPWNRVLLEKLSTAQLAIKIFAYYENQSFITIFTRYRHWIPWLFYRNLQ